MACGSSCAASTSALVHQILWRPRVPGPLVTGGRPAEEDSQPVEATAAAAAGRAAAATAEPTERANGSETERRSSATFVWTPPETLSSVCAGIYSGKINGGRWW